MLTKEELLKYPNYLLTTYQLEIFKQLSNYMESNRLKKKDIADKLGVSNSYVSQILAGNFNFTLKKLIELGLLINKVPVLEFVDSDEYWRREEEGTIQYVVREVNYTIKAENAEQNFFYLPNLVSYHGGMLPSSATVSDEVVK